MKDRDRATRQRVLQTAAKLFAARGFKPVTVREICRAAKANVASVNYHFGDKLGLYREVMQMAVTDLQAVTAEAKQMGENCDPEEKLRRFLRLHLQRILDERNGWIHGLVNREIVEPTPALDALVNQGIRPRVDYLTTIVADLMGCQPSDPRVQRSVGSTVAQVMTYRPNPLATRLGAKAKWTSTEIDDIANHIADFSLAGIRAIACSDQ